MSGPGNPKSSFTPARTTIATRTGTESPRVVKISEPDRPKITAFEMTSVRNISPRQQASQPRPAAFEGVSAQARKDRRFSLSALVQDPDKLAAEERSLIDAQVSAKLEQELERTRQAAFEQGFEEGRRQGAEQAHAEASIATQAELERVRDLVASFEKAKAEIYQANERYLLELVFRVSRMLLLKELSTDKEYLSRLARELVERLGARENIRIKLNPKDSDQISQIRTELSKAVGGELRNLSIEADSGISGGGLEVQTEWSALDASVDTQLKAIHEALTGCST